MMMRIFRLNTLTVGQPLVGAALVTFQWRKVSLNTLTVGQPLVGFGDKLNVMGHEVSIPSQLGSLLLVAR